MVYPHDAEQEAELEDRGFYVEEEDLAPEDDVVDTTYIEEDLE